MQRSVEQAVSEFLTQPEQWDISLSGTWAVHQLERKFAALTGLPYAIGVTNATLGLWAVFHALDIHDAEVITTPYSWGGSLAGLIMTGNRPVFADIDRETLTLDLVEVTSAITRHTKAILAVDIYGYPCDERLREIADAYGLVLIQDCAQSFGAYMRDQHTGFWAHVAVFSLTYGKALFAGEGGMILTHDESLFHRVVWETQHPHRQRRDVPHLTLNEFGVNLRIHPLAAVWANVRFEEALRQVQQRRDHCQHILNILRLAGLSRTNVPDTKRIASAFSALTFEPNIGLPEVQEYVETQGWNLRVNFPSIRAPLYAQESYQCLSAAKAWERPSHCPIAEGQCRRRVQLVSPLGTKD